MSSILLRKVRMYVFVFTEEMTDRSTSFDIQKFNLRSSNIPSASLTDNWMCNYIGVSIIEL